MLLTGVSAMANKLTAQQKVSVNYGNIVWGQLNLTNTVGYEDETGDMVSIAIIRYDTIFDDQGNVESISAKDFLVKVNKDDFKKIKSSQKAFWVHAKWVVKKNGIYTETKPPKDINKPGKKICLVFQFGVIEKMHVPENTKNNTGLDGTSSSNTSNSNNSGSSSSNSSGCPTTPCPEGKVRNTATCNCEPKSNR